MYVEKLLIRVVIQVIQIDAKLYAHKCLHVATPLAYDNGINNMKIKTILEQSSQ